MRLTYLIDSDGDVSIKHGKYYSVGIDALSGELLLFGLANYKLVTALINLRYTNTHLRFDASVSMLKVITSVALI